MTPVDESNWPEFHLAELLRQLVAQGVDFVVIGGIAAIAHGSPRLTRDLDIAYARDQANLEALGTVLVGLDSKLFQVDEEVPFVADAASLANVQLLTLTTSAGRLDVMTQPAGAPPYDVLRSRAIRERVAGVSGACRRHRRPHRDEAGGRKAEGPGHGVAELEAIKRLSS